MQKLLRLNRCQSGKVKTYVLKRVNDTQGVLDMFNTYFVIATLKDVINPDITLKRQAKLNPTAFMTSMSSTVWWLSISCPWQSSS